MSSLFGFWIINKARKLNARLLGYMGLFIIFVGTSFLDVSFDFITLLLTGNNMDDTYGIFSITSYILTGPLLILGIFIYAELLLPKRKKEVTFIFVIIGILLSFFVLLDPINYFDTIALGNPGEVPMQSSIVFFTPFFFISMIAISGTILTVFGCFYKSLHLKGILRTKFTYLGIGNLLFSLGSILEALIPAGVFIIFARITLTSSIIFYYFGIKEESAEPKKLRPKKEVKIEESLFRLSKKPESITEEEVMFLKERKICLVCKGKALKYTYICQECDALYCQNCAQSLENLENACWVCNAPIDDSRPVKLIKSGEEEVRIDKSKKPLKKS